MRIQIATVGRKKSGPLSPASRLVEEYLQRTQHFIPVSLTVYKSEEALLSSLLRPSDRSTPRVVLLDSRGKSMTSTRFAETIGNWRDGGVKELIFAVGPADGWSSAVNNLPSPTKLSLGPMTLPHELALVVFSEQLYRAFTIIAGHPYHCEH